MGCSKVMTDIITCDRFRFCVLIGVTVVVVTGSSAAESARKTQHHTYTEVIYSGDEHLASQVLVILMGT